MYIIHREGLFPALLEGIRNTNREPYHLELRVREKYARAVYGNSGMPDGNNTHEVERQVNSGDWVVVSKDKLDELYRKHKR